MSPAGARPPERKELGRFENRLSFIYVEQCVIHRDANALTFTDDSGVAHLPAASVAALTIGPGTRITHAAMGLLGVCGVSVVWVGEQGVRYYAHGRPLSGSSRMAETQARLVSNSRSRVQVARAMYLRRFNEPDIDQLSIRELRGREGTRMRRLYREHSERTGVPWSGRQYDPDDFDASDPINMALTAASAALYGIAHAGIVALGCIPSLGFVHRGTDRAFVFDIADLYKAEISIPTAFDVVASGSTDIAGDTRRAVRDAIVKSKLMRRIPRDIAELLSTEGDEESDVLHLWDTTGSVSAGLNYGTFES